MVDPVSMALVPVIIAVVRLMATAVLTARQSKDKCLKLNERAQTLADVLPNFANDEGTARVLERLKVAVDEALKLIESCQGVGIVSKADKLDRVNNGINDCIRDLNLIHIGQARTNKVPLPPQAVHVDYHNYCYQAQGGAASSSHVACPPTPLYVWGAPAPPQGYYYPQPASYPPYYAAAPAPSGSNLFPTVKKVVKRLFP